MKSKYLFRAALTVMCAIVFSVCLGSCDKNEDAPYQEETPYSFRADTNGVDITVVPFLKWGCDISEIKEYVAQYYPDWVAKNDGKLYLDTCDGCWTLKYYENGKDSSYVWFDFVGENGNTFNMTGFHFNKSGDIQKIRDEIESQGFRYKGLFYWENYPHELTYLYLSADEKLEVQLYTNNDETEEYWCISFQPTDKDDFNYKIDETDFSINIKADEGTYSLHPLLDWDATLTDIRRYMSDNYPDWEAKEGGRMIKDSTDYEESWYVKYAKDSMGVCFYFNDENGDVYDLLQYVYYSSTDISQVQSELTRNGLVYIDVEELWDPDEISALGYAPLSEDYYVSLETWNINGGCWCLNISSYDE